MSIYINQNIACGSGTGSTSCVSWYTWFATTPIIGNFLVLYLASIDNLSINSITSPSFGTAIYNWTNNYNSLDAGCNIYIYSLPVTNNLSQIQINLNSGDNNFYSVIDEVQGVSGVFDVQNDQQGVGSIYNTGLTSAVTGNNEYWVNVYAWKNTSKDAIGTSPTNGYTIIQKDTTWSMKNENPVTFNSTGWNGTGVGSHINAHAGIIIAKQIKTGIGSNVHAGCSIQDINGTASNWNALALTIK